MIHCVGNATCAGSGTAMEPAPGIGFWCSREVAVEELRSKLTEQDERIEEIQVRL